MTTPEEPDILWVGTQRGLDRLDLATGTFGHFTHDPEDPETLSDPRVRSLYKDASGVLWVGTEQGGLNRFDFQTESFSHFTYAPADSQSLSHNTVYAIAADPVEADVLWIGTGGGLNRFDVEAGSFTRFTEQNSDIPNNVVMGIVDDDQGRLWLGTNGSISRFDAQSHAFVNYDVPGGLQAIPAAPVAAYQSRRGRIFFGGANGFYSFFPDQIGKNPVLPQVVLTQVIASDQPLPLNADNATTEPISLRHDRHDLAFDYVALHYSDPAKNQYAYQLEGYDATWRTAGTQRRAVYTNLPPGDYVFRVKASNSDGLWNEEGASLRFTILPPWWRTWWAYAFYGLLLAAGLVAVGQVQRRRLIRRERERAMQRELEQARQLEAMNQQLRRHEQQLEDQNRRLLELDQLKSRFFANISHEFRTPLTLILGPLRDMLDEAFAPLPDAQRAQLSLMQRNGQRLLRLINELLDLSRLEAGRLNLRARRANLVPLVKATAQAFASLAHRKKITLQVDAPREEIMLHFEPEKIEKVIYNLLSNAFKFTPEHGTVEVCIQEDKTGGHVEVVVRDTGRGIPIEALPFIFDRFHQVDTSSTREHEGTGIGLALTRELVTLHGGTVRVESEVGAGSTFTVRLPNGRAHLSDQAIADAEASAETSEALNERGPAAILDASPASENALYAGNSPAAGSPPEDAPVILIVEDNEDMRAYLRSHLAADYRIVEAPNGVEGLEQARTLKPSLVLSDVMMPRMDGYDLCQAIKSDATLHDIPVVLLTAKADEESRIEGLKTGADDYLYKPFHAKALRVRVENLIEIRRRLRTHFSKQVGVKPAKITVASADAVFLEDVRRIVEAELHDRHFSVERLAEELHMSPRTLRRKLQALTRLSPSGYIRSMRLERAAQLLAQQAGRVSEVAHAVGFHSAPHFSRLFQQIYGVAPSHYSDNQE